MSEKKQILCPVCHKPSVDAYKPFCSKRCADVDLNRWLSGVYVIHTNEKPDDETDVSSEDEKN